MGPYLPICINKLEVQPAHGWQFSFVPLQRPRQAEHKKERCPYTCAYARYHEMDIRSMIKLYRLYMFDYTHRMTKRYSNKSNNCYNPNNNTNNIFIIAKNNSNSRDNNMKIIYTHIVIYLMNTHRKF